MEYQFVPFENRFYRAITTLNDDNKRYYLIKRGCKLLSRFDEYLQDETINKWASLSGIPHKLLKAWVNNEDPGDQITENDRLRQMLRSFNIQLNELTDEYIIEKSGVNYSLDELKLEAEQTVSRNSLKNINKFLNPNNTNITVVQTFNPLADKFKSLADEYEGGNNIEKLANCIEPYSFGKKDKTKYRERLHYFIKKWLMMAAAQALKRTVNEVMLLWLDPIGGTGKSYLNEWMFDFKELRDYYHKIPEAKSFMNFEGLAKSKFVIDMDDLPLTKKRYQSFKGLIASKSLPIYDKKSQKYTTYGKMGNFIGSTNMANREGQPGFILEYDQALMRRICPLEIESIDYEKYMEIHPKQLWGEAAFLALRAKKEQLSWENDMAKLREINETYVDTTQKNISDEQMILHIFEKTNKKDTKTRELSIDDMIEYIRERKNRNIRISRQKISKLLGRHKYKQIRKRKDGKLLRLWLVKIDV